MSDAPSKPVTNYPSSDGIVIIDIPWNYRLFKRGEDLVLNVWCTSWVNRSAEWDVDHTLTPDEVALYEARGQAYLEELKAIIKHNSEQGGFDNWARAYPKLAKQWALQKPRKKHQPD